MEVVQLDCKVYISITVKLNCWLFVLINKLPAGSQCFTVFSLWNTNFWNQKVKGYWNNVQEIMENRVRRNSFKIILCKSVKHLKADADFILFSIVLLSFFFFIAESFCLIAQANKIHCNKSNYQAMSSLKHRNRSHYIIILEQNRNSVIHFSSWLPLMGEQTQLCKLHFKHRFK